MNFTDPEIFMLYAYIVNGLPFSSVSFLDYIMFS